MITHRCRLTTGLRTACLLTLFLLTLTSISSGGVPAAVKDLKDNDVGIRLGLLQPMFSSLRLSRPRKSMAHGNAGVVRRAAARSGYLRLVNSDLKLSSSGTIFISCRTVLEGPE